LTIGGEGAGAARGAASWRGAAGFLLCAAVAALLPWRPIDTGAARLFYRPAAPGGAWQPPEAIWRALGAVTPCVAILLAAAGLGLLLHAALASPPARRGMRPGLMILLGLVLGPGLLVNAIGKDHWHRPRPRQTAGLGGDFAYVMPLHVGPAGKSFPCGHASVGFACAAVGFAVAAGRRRARQRWFAASSALGALLGLGRVATGAHFVSDVVWAALLTYASLFLVALAVRPDRAPVPAAGSTSWRVAPTEAGSASSRARRFVVAFGALVLSLGVGAFFVPFRRNLPPEPIAGDLTAGAPWRVRIDVEVGHARLILDRGSAFLREAHYDGFGLPGGRLDEATRLDPEARVLTTRLRPQGLFADLEGVATYRVPKALVGALEVEVHDGMLTVENQAGQGPVPEIDCRIRKGALRLRGDLRRDQVRLLPR
jgi:membrane-associated PAP2 superfamily phosphatase